tara:strand:- start:63 stop:1040 length:978 start_codon:yes stop_codon:yes gene_type:complete
MIDAAENSFRSRLFAKDKKGSLEYLNTNLAGEKLVSILHDLIFFSVLVESSHSTIHPVCIVNSIKNFISDDRLNPSVKLISFVLDYLFQFDLRANDKFVLDESLKKGVVNTAFVGDLEDACQNSQWGRAELLLAEIFIASDQSRGVFDALAELALQDCPQYALFVYHILRAYQFQESKKDNWTFTCSLFNYIKNRKLPKPHKYEKIDLEILWNDTIHNGDVTLFSAMFRILEDSYTRSSGYNREISYWLSKTNFSKQKNSMNRNRLNVQNSISFILLAEKIISMEKPENQKLMDIITLEALRSMMKKNDAITFEALVNRFSYFSL